MRCSCGCGRKVGFKDRRAGKRAAAARALVAEMEALGFDVDEDEYRRALLFEGVSWRNQYTRVVHGELSREQTRAEPLWQVWRSDARVAVSEARRARRESP